MEKSLLGAIRVRASIGHGQNAWAHVHQLKVLVLKLCPIDAASPSAIVIGEILQALPVDGCAT